MRRSSSTARAGCSAATAASSGTIRAGRRAQLAPVQATRHAHHRAEEQPADGVDQQADDPVGGGPPARSAVGLTSADASSPRGCAHLKQQAPSQPGTAAPPASPASSTARQAQRRELSGAGAAGNAALRRTGERGALHAEARGVEEGRDAGDGHAEDEARGAVAGGRVDGGGAVHRTHAHGAGGPACRGSGSARGCSLPRHWHCSTAAACWPRRAADQRHSAELSELRGARESAVESQAGCRRSARAT